MNFRKKLISLLTFLGGIYFFLEFILPTKLPDALGAYEFGKYHNQISNGFIAVGSVAFALGLINILYVHGSKIIFARRGAINSAALILSLFTMLFLTLNEWIVSERFNAGAKELRDLAAFSRQIKSDAESKKLLEISTSKRVEMLVSSVERNLVQIDSSLSKAPTDTPPLIIKELTAGVTNLKSELKGASDDASHNEKFKDLNSLETIAAALVNVASNRQKLDELSYKHSSTKAVYDFVYEGFFVPLGSAMFALLGFYIISAGYRAFRIKSAESALMMVAAIVVMLGQIPFYSYIYEGLPDLRLWLLQVPSAAAFRSIKFGAAVAGLYMAIRMWFSVESSSFSKDGGGADT